MEIAACVRVSLTGAQDMTSATAPCPTHTIQMLVWDLMASITRKQNSNNCARALENLCRRRLGKFDTGPTAPSLPSASTQGNPNIDFDKYVGKTLWPSGLRRWLKAPVRKGVGSNPTGVTSHCICGFAFVLFSGSNCFCVGACLCLCFFLWITVSNNLCSDWSF